MTLHTMFLRKECSLPDHICLPQEAVGDSWVKVTEICASALDLMIRQAGWHFMYVQGSSSRTSVGLTYDGAIQQALLSALKGIASRFNAAELESVHMSKYPGFHIAKVTLQPRKIQHHTALDSVEKSGDRVMLAR
jgi:hypothetical protein